ncbi:hypothetical protein T440DRAFT_472565 [Plenodomus tracheiphilus IPT5]|uniref:NAD(P)-binding protein n=1 Tax=Plenodomus tracheiphilus IPT5 TaxID=1408161 RepID=A0A6A7AT36_9PLEO|nr:hypothetical protein T440DRAFT_472565 [Plenodomus tracheiphilus IPT5]
MPYTVGGIYRWPPLVLLLGTYPMFTLLLTVRDDSDRDPNTRELRRIIGKHPDVDVTVRKLDLNALEDVRVFSDSVLADIENGTQPRIGAIVCNAMTWSLSGGPKYSEDGFEKSIAINHLAHFSMTLRLLGGMDPMRGRIVFLGSIAHWPDKAGFSKGFPTHVPDDLELLVHPHSDAPTEEMGRGFQRYGTSKLVPVMIMFELNRRLKAVSCQPKRFRFEGNADACNRAEIPSPFALLRLILLIWSTLEPFPKHMSQSWYVVCSRS